MLFFHRGLRSLVAVDLKISEFMPEYISKMNLYLSLLDRLERGKDENPSIGIILCAEKDNVEVELALEGFTKPIGVAEYKLIVPQKELKQLITDEIKPSTKKLPTNQQNNQKEKTEHSLSFSFHQPTYIVWFSLSGIYSARTKPNSISFSTTVPNV